MSETSNSKNSEIEQLKTRANDLACAIQALIIVILITITLLFLNAIAFPIFDLVFPISFIAGILILCAISYTTE